MNEVRSDSPDAREFIKASGLLYLLRFVDFPRLRIMKRRSRKPQFPTPREKNRTRDLRGNLYTRRKL